MSLPLSQRRPLGRSGIAVSSLCLGGNVFGWTIDEACSFAVLDAFLAGGGNFIDTADVYSAWAPGHVGGESEVIIGKWMKSRGVRDQIVLATKLGMLPSGAGLSAAHIRKASEDSLRRLQIDRIDLLYAHRDDPSTPVAETVRAFDALVKAGKVRAVGASNFDAARLAASLDLAKSEHLARYEVLQPEYNAVVRDSFEGDLQALCAKESVSTAPYFALAAGFLTGKYQKDKPLPESMRSGGVQSKYANAHGWKVLAAVTAVARKHGATPSQVALAWLAAQPTVAAPIASATSVEQLQETMAFEKITLSAEDLTQLDLH
jgi:aryl-alcohol dehydrogenase-like predicted oxidoreductase